MCKTPRSVTFIMVGSKNPQEDILSFTLVVVKHLLSLVIDENYLFFYVQMRGCLSFPQRKWLIFF
jgi:hypothetical protein